MKRLNIYTIIIVFIVCSFCSCTHSVEELKFPDSLSDLNTTSTEINVPLDSSAINMQIKGLACNTWLKGSGSRCGLVKDCDNPTYEEAKKIGDRLAASINKSTKEICKDLGCPKREFRKIKWTQGECKRRILCISVSYEFRCTEN